MAVSTASRAAAPVSPEELALLDSIQRRVLWLSIYLIHHANHLRPNPDGSKVGGHQASCASVVSLMTALYFRWLQPGDRVSVKPHASPVFHAVHALRGRLPPEYLPTLRAYGGLQAYPSRTKDPDPVDFSTGSVGLGAVLPAFAALAHRYVRDHFPGARPPGRYVALVGDAELDEGNVWEALGEEYLMGQGGLVWIVDLNRQSLDRVVPAGRAQRIRDMFRTNGWHVVELKYGSRLEAVFRWPGGERLRQAIDDMPNAEYQRLIRSDGAAVRRSLVEGLWRGPEARAQQAPAGEPLARPGESPARDPGLPGGPAGGAGRPDGARRSEVDPVMAELLAPFSDAEVRDLLADLAGHDLARILAAYDEADRVTDRPVVILAYTIKGWGLPFAGDPLNHSALLTAEQLAELAARLGIRRGEEWALFPPDSPEGRYIAGSRATAAGAPPAAAAPGRPARVPPLPEQLDIAFKPVISTQEALGQVLLARSRRPEIAARLVTASPDVAISTHLGGWINRVGVYRHESAPDLFAADGMGRPLRWEQSPQGRHIELGISENNLFLLLAALGLADEFTGEPLLPVGTLYDPFVARGLDAFIYGVYNGARFVVAGTPSGISLSPEGGAHQSIVTPAVGLQLPGVTYYEPAFAREVEWLLLAALANLHRPETAQTVYLRLGTKPVDQRLFPAPASAEGRAALRAAVLRGAYLARDARGAGEAGKAAGVAYRPGENVVNVFTCGAMVPEALEAAARLAADGVRANVVAVTSPDLLYRGYALTARLTMKRAGVRARSYLERLVSQLGAGVPAVTVMDGHSHTLTFVGAALGCRVVPLGVDEFGQSGDRPSLYRRYEIDAEAIIQAAHCALRP